MLHQYPCPVLRVVYLTAAVLGRQCENKKGMKRPMSNRLKNILAALADIISIREREKEEGTDEEIVLVLSFSIMAHSKLIYCFQIVEHQKILLFFCYWIHINLNKNAILLTGSHLFYSTERGAWCNSSQAKSWVPADVSEGCACVTHSLMGCRSCPLGLVSLQLLTLLHWGPLPTAQVSSTHLEKLRLLGVPWVQCHGTANRLGWVLVWIGEPWAVMRSWKPKLFQFGKPEALRTQLCS